MSQIEFRDAPLKMRTGVVGIGEDHTNHWGRMLVLKLLQCQGARHLLIETAADQQSNVDNITTAAGGFDDGAAKACDRVSWCEKSVVRLSSVIYQAQKRGVAVICADDTCVYTASFSVSPRGMARRNAKAVQTLLGLAGDPSQLKGVIMLNGKDHFDEGRSSIAKLLQSSQGLNFGWVDATTQDSSGYGVQVA